MSHRDPRQPRDFDRTLMSPPVEQRPVDRRNNGGNATPSPVAAAQLMEERLKKKKDQGIPGRYQKVLLKNNAGEIELGWERTWEEDLRDLRKHHPEHFLALHALVEGRPEEVSERHRRDLKKWWYLQQDGSPLPDVKAVMQALFSKTPQGGLIMNDDPLDVKTLQDAMKVVEYDDAYETRVKNIASQPDIAKIIKRTRGKDDKARDGNEGPSR
jgi:hypothetical protein